MNHGLMALDVSYAERARGGGANTNAKDGGASLDHARALVARLRTGDAAALGEAYDLHHAHVRTFARRLVGDDASAEDVVQDTFVALPGAIRRFRGEASLRTFLLGVAVNHARHHVRAAARRRAAMERLGGELPRPRAASPEEAAEGEELARTLARGLDELSLDHRAAFVLCEVEERSSAEAALVLSVPEATVRTRLLHAKKKLRAWFEKRGVR
jgi:RNA polymerase sigma-70 factor (ECF subfamily)